MEYDFKKIEKKWQEKWEKEKLYEVKKNPKKEKFYCLIEFPYPSGEGLHVGHPRSYTALDIIARKHRMQGQNVLYPIGWDAFGLPTENYAIKTGIQPAMATEKNIKNFTRQLKSLGFSFDWSREINTTDPEYYKWTQWMFLQFFQHGMAYKAEIPVNWCTKCETGLANEEVINNECERCGGPVVKKTKEQWMLKITKYAERLLSGLEKVDYSPRIKEGQINWIGKSEGAEVDFEIKDLDLKIKVFTTRPDTLFGATYMVLAPEHKLIENLKFKIENWQEVEKYIDGAKHKSDLERQESKEKTGVELKGIKAINPVNNEEIPIWVADYVLAGYGTGAIMAVPAHDERDFAFAKKFGLPIKYVVARSTLIDDRVFDDRVESKLIPLDREIVKKKNNEITKIMVAKDEPWTCNGYLINSSDEYTGEINYEAKEKITKWLEEKHIGKKAVNYKLRDWVFSRQRYWGEPIPLVYCENCAKKKQKVLLIHGFEGSGEGNWLPWMKKELEARGFEVFNPTMTTSGHPTVESWLKELMPFAEKLGEDDIIVGHSLGSKAALHLVAKAKKKIGHLFLIASAVGTVEERDWEKFRKEWKGSDVDALKKFWHTPIDWNAVDKFVQDKNIVLSDDDPYIKKETHKDLPPGWFYELWSGFGHFQKKQIPELLNLVLAAKNNGWVPVPEKDLPVKLPKVENYKPTSSGESPLAAAENWVATKCPKCGGEARRETDTMPNWAGSSWYFLRYTDPKNKKEFSDAKNLKYWMPVDWYNGGMEHNNLHLLYSRFWYKFLYDIGVIPKECGDEPYKKRTSHGLILGEGGEKMSKSRGNVVNPDDIVARFGADTLRVYEMFMGPFEQAIPWDEKGVVGVFRFLEKVIRVYYELVYHGAKKISYDNKQQQDELTRVLRSLHKTIKKVGEDIEQMKFNTAVAAMMSFLNNVEGAHLEISQDDFEKFLLILAPFAPHIAEEIWRDKKNGFGHEKSIHLEKWPKYDPALIVEEEIDLIVQVNGKVRDTIRVKADISEEEAKKVAAESEKVKKWTENQKIKKIIFVKGKLVNIVV